MRLIPLPNGNGSDAVLFTGLAATFLLVAVLARRRWAVYPALAAAVVGLLAAAPRLVFAEYLGPILLIGIGAYLLVRYFRKTWSGS